MIFRKVVLAVALMGAWTCVTGYGAISGWWLKPIAAKGDTQAFFTAATEAARQQGRGNIALVLVRQGEVFDEYFAPSTDHIDRDTLFPLASMSKWVTAYSVMQLVQAGKIDLDAPVSRYLKRWQLPKSTFNNEAVTVRRLLSHTAGLTDGLGFGDYQPDEAIPTLEASLQAPKASSGERRIEMGQEPGKWRYSGGGYLILQLIVEEVSGLSFADWTQQAVFNPLGMNRSTYSYPAGLDNVAKSYDASGKVASSYRYAAAAATGLSSSTSDLVRFVRAQVRADRSAALNQASVIAMRKAHGSTLGADIWGLGTMLYAPTPAGDNVFGHDGSNAPAISTTARINPDNGDAIVILVTGNTGLASQIAYEWTLWQTGQPDFLNLKKAIASAWTPLIVGIVAILVAFAFIIVRARRRVKRTG